MQRQALTVWLAAIALAVGVGAPRAEALTLPSPFAGGARIDGNEAGFAVVAWAGPSGVRAVAGDRAGSFGAPAVLSQSGDVPSPPLVGVDERGNAVVAWETARTVAPGCRGCEAYLVSTGVWVALRPAGDGFDAPVRLAAPFADRGSRNVAAPRLAVNARGDAIVAWSDPEGSAAVVRAAGGSLSPAQRIAPTGFSVSSVAVTEAGEMLVVDTLGRVVTRPADGSFAAPQTLPEATGALGKGVVLAANGTEAIATYPGARGLMIARRTATGAWGSPAVLTSVSGAALAGAVVAPSGEGTALWLEGGDPRLGQHTGVFGALSTPAATVTGVQRITPADRDADMSRDGAGLDVAAVGDVAVAWYRYDAADYLFAKRGAQLAVRPGGGVWGAPLSLTAPEAEEALGDTPDVAVTSRGELLAAWVDVYAREARLTARSRTTAGLGPPIVLDTVTLPDLPAPTRPRGHFASVAVQSAVTPSKRGYVAVRLSCVSNDGRSCTGTLTLTRASSKSRAGRRRFAIAPNRRRRVFVRLSRPTRVLLRRHGRVTLVATAVTVKPNGAHALHREQVFLKARPH